MIYPLISILEQGYWRLFLSLTAIFFILSYYGISGGLFEVALLNLAFAMLFILPGAYLRRYRRLVQKLHLRDLEDSRRLMVERLAMEVHDTALTSLTREILRIRSLSETAGDAVLESSLREVEKGLLQVSETMRSIFHMRESNYRQVDTIDDVLAEGESILKVNGIKAEFDVDLVALGGLTQEMLHFALISLREAFINAAKYSALYSTVHVDVSMSKRTIDMVVSSEIDNSHTDLEEISSGWGVSSLMERACGLGIEFYAGRNCNKWVHVMSFPLSGKSGGSIDHAGSIEVGENE